MKGKLRFLLLAGVLVTCAPPTVDGAEPDLAGMYAAAGQNPDGTEYRAVVKIVPRDESFQVMWLFPKVDGEVITLVLKSAGVGVANGGMLAVSYYGQDLTGVILYQIENGGERLSGRRVVAGGDGRVHSETLTKLPPTFETAPRPSPRTEPERPASTDSAVVGR